MTRRRVPGADRDGGDRIGPVAANPYAWPYDGSVAAATPR